MMEPSVKKRPTPAPGTQARLIGGPCDGDVVNLTGWCFVKKMARSLKAVDYFNFYEALYLWDIEGEEFVGRFNGYWRDGKKVDKLGRKLAHSRRKRPRPLPPKVKLRVVRAPSKPR